MKGRTESAAEELIRVHQAADVARATFSYDIAKNKTESQARQQAAPAATQMSPASYWAQIPQHRFPALNTVDDWQKLAETTAWEKINF
jgi:hypothetical protein